MIPNSKMLGWRRKGDIAYNSLKKLFYLLCLLIFSSQLSHQPADGLLNKLTESLPMLCYLWSGGDIKNLLEKFRNTCPVPFAYC